MSDDPLSLDDGLRHLSTLVIQEETLDTTLQRIVDVATRAIPDTLGVSITLLRNNRHPYTAVASNPTVQAIDEREYGVDEGPCIDAMRTGEPQLLDDVAGEERWPAFTAICRDAGVGSVLGLPLRIGGQPYGAMNLYALGAGVFGDEEQAAATLLVQQAAIALANSRTYDDCSDKIRQLQEALESRVVIEQAKGVLMASQSCDPDTAFGILRERSQRGNRKLRQVAADVVAPFLRPT